MYVSQDCEITVRTGASTEHKIIAMLKPGASVEVLEPGDEWSQVRTSSGKEGWMLSRYLTSREPPALTLDRTEKKVEQLTAQHNDIMEKNATLEAENKRLESTLASTRTSLERVTKEHETLKKEPISCNSKPNMQKQPVSWPKSKIKPEGTRKNPSGC